MVPRTVKFELRSLIQHRMNGQGLAEILLNSLKLNNVLIEDPTLEEIFMHYYE